MANTPMVENIPQLQHLGNVVPDGYHYYEKIITPGEDLSLPNAYLKWYDLYPSDAPITPDQRDECRAYVSREAESLPLKNELGFVILHRAGTVLLLLLTTWRNTNEMWEAVYVKDLTGSGGYEAINFETRHRATYCVWELGAVWHERDAWVRFLSSQRDNAAKLAYINDRFSGRV